MTTHAFPRVVLLALLACAVMSLWKAERTWRLEPASTVPDRMIHMTRGAWLLMLVGSAWLARPAAGTAGSTCLYSRSEGAASWTRAIAIGAAVGAAGLLLVRALMPFLGAGLLARWL